MIFKESLKLHLAGNFWYHFVSATIADKKMAYSEPYQTSKTGPFGKIPIVFQSHYKSIADKKA